MMIRCSEVLGVEYLVAFPEHFVSLLSKVILLPDVAHIK